MQEKRSLERRDLIYYLRIFDGKTDKLLGHVANISTEGIMIIGEKLIEPNTTFHLKMLLPVEIRGKKRVEFEANSRWCKSDSNPDFLDTGFKLIYIAPDDFCLLERLYSDPTIQSGPTLTLKRLFDAVVSFIGLIIFLPVFLIIGLVLRLQSPYPIFYNAERVGKFGRLFRMYKFRTMTGAPGDNGPRITAFDDPRITRVGRFLRQTKLNELPQLFNVLKGEMSLVGPRPEYPEFVARYTPDQREAISVEPGITSMASILYADEEHLLHFKDVTGMYMQSILPDKLRLDLLYVQNQSILLDIDILIQTILVLIPRFRMAAPHAEDLLLEPARMARRGLSWFTIDAIITFLAVGVVGVIWRSIAPLDVGLDRSLIAAFVMTSLFSIINWITGVQRVQWRYASAAEAVDVFFSVFISTFLLMAINYLALKPRFPNPMLLVMGVFALSGFLVARYHRRLLLGLRNRFENLRASATSGRERVLVVGAGEVGQLTIWLLRNNPASRAFHVVGVVDDNLDLLGSLVHRVPVLGICDHIPEIVHKKDVGTIVFPIHSIEENRKQYLLRLCHKTSARTVIVPDLIASLRQGMVGDTLAEPGWTIEYKKDDTKLERVSADLRDQIHRLNEMAHKGDFVGLTHGLDQLDMALKEAGQINPGVSSESAIPKHQV